MRILGAVISLTFWPYMLIAFLNEPIVARRTVLGRKARGLITWESSMRNELLAEGVYDHDLRIVFALQLTAVLTVVAIVTLLNAAGIG